MLRSPPKKGQTATVSALSLSDLTSANCFGLLFSLLWAEMKEARFRLLAFSFQKQLGGRQRPELRVTRGCSVQGGVLLRREVASAHG